EVEPLADLAQNLFRDRAFALRAARAVAVQFERGEMLARVADGKLRDLADRAAVHLDGLRAAVEPPAAAAGASRFRHELLEPFGETVLRAFAQFLEIRHEPDEAVAVAVDDHLALFLAQARERRFEAYARLF